MSDATEHWLPVVGYEGCYEVSDQGRARSVTRVVHLANGRSRVARGCVLKPYLHPKQRRFSVTLWRDNTSKNVLVARLVLSAFRGPAPDDADGCHNNGNSMDDRLVNLRWDSRHANVLDAVRHGTHHSARKTHCPRNHLLVGENIVVRRDKPGRQCKACNRAAAAVQYAKRTGREYDFVAWADDYYARIMDESAA